MIIFICAQDKFRALQRKKEIIENFQKENQLSTVFIFDLENEDYLKSFFNFLENQSLFGNKKLGVVYNLFLVSSKEIANKIKYFAKNPGIFILIYEEKSPPSELKFLTKPPVVYEIFETLKGKKWTNFVIEEIKKRKIKLTASALNFLIQAYLGDSFRLVTELDKIALFSKSFDLKDLNNLDIDTTPDFWFLFNQLKNKDLKFRISALENLLAVGEPAGKLFNILAYSWPEKTENFAIYDRAVKSGKLDYEEALLDVIL